MEPSARKRPHLTSYSLVGLTSGVVVAVVMGILQDDWRSGALFGLVWAVVWTIIDAVQHRR